MKILVVSDEPSAKFWDYYRPGMLKEYDLILSAGDLPAEYLSFLVTMAHCPVLYVHGNHDEDYKDNPPEGCDCVDDKLVICKGLRILGLGGSRRYKRGEHQYTEEQMRRRLRKLKRTITMAGGVDIVLAHAAPLGVGDAEDAPHRGFAAFLECIDAYRPQYLLHGHVHLNYGVRIERERAYQGTKVINCCGHMELSCDPSELNLPHPSRFKRLLVRNYENMSD